MNKKKLMTFGVLGLFSLVLVSAGLITYFSSVQGTVTIESPLELTGAGFEISEDWNVEFSSDFSLTNNINEPIDVIVEVVISGNNSPDSNFDELNVGKEFVTLKIGLQVLDLDTCDYLGGIDYNTDSESYCYWDASTDKAYSGVIGGNYYVQMGDRQDIIDGLNPIPADTTMNGRLKVEFKTDVEPATYTFDIKAMNPTDSKDLA